MAKVREGKRPNPVSHDEPGAFGVGGLKGGRQQAGDLANLCAVAQVAVGVQGR